MLKSKHQQGVTIVQILVFIGIIGAIILVFMILFSIDRAKTRDYIRISNIKQTQAALEMFYNQNGSYPATASAPTGGGSGHNWLPSTEDKGINNTFESFLPQLLIAPLPADSAVCNTRTACNGDNKSVANDFCYTAGPEGCSTSSEIKCTDYFLDFCISNQIGELASGTHRITSSEIK